MRRRPVTVVLLVSAVLLSGCEEKGLFGLTLGVPTREAEASFEPEAGAGQWADAGAGRRRWEDRAGVPVAAGLLSDRGTVVGYRVVLEESSMRAARLSPESTRHALLKKQAADAQGPFEHGGLQVWLTDEALRTAGHASDGWAVARWDRSAAGLSSRGCEDVGSRIVRLQRGLEGRLGEEGERPGVERDRAVRRLRLQAAALELTCPEHAGVMTTVADFFRMTGEANGAARRYHAALELDARFEPRHRADALGGLALVDARYGRSDRARERFSTAVVSAPDAARRAHWAARWGDAAYAAGRWEEAADAYDRALSESPEEPTGERARALARLLRSRIEGPGGCARVAFAAKQAAALSTDVPERAKAELFAARAFHLLACAPRRRPEALDLLERAVKLDPLRAAEWARLTGYYDREANDAQVLEIMLEQGWIDRRGLESAREYQRLMREEARGGR